VLFAFLLPSLNRGVVGALVCLPRESRRSVLVRAAGQWAQAPLSARVALITDINRSFIALSLPCTISCTTYKRLSLRLSHGISCRVSGLDSSIQSFRRLLCIGAVVLFPAVSAPAMAHGGDRGKHPHDVGSSRPHRMPAMPTING
jgi:hypothetical protein